MNLKMCAVDSYLYVAVWCKCNREGSEEGDTIVIPGHWNFP